MHSLSTKLPPPFGGWGAWLGGLLFLLLLLFASCKSSRSVEVKTDSISVQSVHVEDSRHSDLSFQFDRFDVFYFDSLEVDSTQPTSYTPKLVKHVAITNGKVVKAESCELVKQESDSTVYQHQDVIHPVITQPKLPSWLIIAMLIFLIYIIIGQRTTDN